MTGNIDVVIPYRHHEEATLGLKWVLRSLEAHMPGMGEVFVVGDHPEGFNAKLNVLERDPELGSPIGGKWLDIYHNVYVGAIVSSTMFLYCADDHVLWKPCTYTELGKIWCANYVGPESKKEATIITTFWSSTKRALEAQGYTTWYYETHHPKLIWRPAFFKTYDRFSDRGARLWQSLYFNANWRNKPPCLWGTMEQARFTESVPKDVMDMKLSAARYLNWNDEGMCPYLEMHLEQKFPTPSSFET